MPTPPPGTRRRPKPESLQVEAPRLGWDEFLDGFAASYRQDHHVSILGPTGTGKTVLARELLECRECVVAIALKRKDKVVSQFTDYGYRIQEHLEIPTVEDRSGRRVPHPAYRRIVLWPHQLRDGENRLRSVAAYREYQRREILRLFDKVREEGGWTIFADDANTLAEPEPPALNLDAELKYFWKMGRSDNATLMMSGQRPAWIPKDAYSAPEHLFFFATRDRNDLERLSDIGAGMDKRELEHIIANLQRHEFLYLRPREHPPLLQRSKVELER